MKLARMGIIAVAVLALSSVAFAQKPSFAGVWTPDVAAAPAPTTPPPAGAEGRGRGMTPSPITVTQTADTLTIESMRGETKVTQSYKLDGTESVNKMTMGRGENAREVETKSTAKWDGDKLVISTTQAGQDGTPVTRTQTWSLDGGNLVIERPGRDGAVQKVVYKKST